MKVRRYHTVEELAKVLGCNRNSIYRWMTKYQDTDYEPPGYDIVLGELHGFSRETVERWAEWYFYIRPDGRYKEGDGL